MDANTVEAIEQAVSNNGLTSLALFVGGIAVFAFIPMLAAWTKRTTERIKNS